MRVYGTVMARHIKYVFGCAEKHSPASGESLTSLSMTTSINVDLPSARIHAANYVKSGLVESTGRTLSLRVAWHANNCFPWRAAYFRACDAKDANKKRVVSHKSKMIHSWFLKLRVFILILFLYAYPTFVGLQQPVASVVQAVTP